MVRHLARSLIAISVLLLSEAGYAVQNNDSPEKYINTENNCNSNVARLHNIHSIAGENDLIIAIARLGSGERSSNFNHRRLYNFRLWLERVSGRRAKTIVTAESDRVHGRGRIEVYVKGKLIDVLGFSRNEDLKVGSCDGTGNIDHLFYRARRRNSR